MRRESSKLWVGITAVLTIVILIFVFPILNERYGMATAILFSIVLVFGMALYYLRGVLMSRPPTGRKGKLPDERT